MIEGVLCTFVETNTTIKSQLEKISTAAHVLMILQRQLKTFIPNQLYHDLQATFEDYFVPQNGRSTIRIFHYS